MKIGILGAGSIAGVLARTMNAMEEVELYAVASRSYDKALAFAKEHNIPNAYGSYEELVKDEGVELIYIATPHSHHYEHMKLCVEGNKPVLCEKSFTMNAKQAREIKELAFAKQVYVAEAIWTRYMPSRKMINDIVASGVIGKISTATANLSYDIDGVERIVRPELAGGALLDVGVYGVNFLFMHMGQNISRVETAVQMTDTGVDAMETITIFYENGTMGVVTAGIYARSDRKGIFYGEKGYIVVENINNPQVIRVYDSNDNLLQEEFVPKQISGYEYQIKEAIRCIEKKRVESESMPLADSLQVMEFMDSVREKWGLIYPQESK